MIFLLISSFQFSTSNQKRNRYYSRHLREIIDLLKKQLEEEILINYNIGNNNDDSQESENYETEVDLNDQVNIELWNKLNEEDMNKMPEINDYSNETVNILPFWNYATHITEENQKAITAQSLVSAPFSRLVLSTAK
ncbi:unnamed protein product [Rotaria sp. Silwood2]|nr:unnamed protein product [Rotaria sp. Silwood2]CAF2907631.1 unnamed protein product [Rotaria sp. Silwood2]CAF3302610.1 unnamed protein product [Rotaria sp. Silwood2]CAF4213274.1 unnamed protein product [Rotaria sp. Silwood2]CAF4403683.1 unnamed protein product [Rotaria sp. Silwood2]